MTKLIDLFVVYQEDGLPHEKMIELPAGLSNAECISFVRASIGESANILNIINVDGINRQKTAVSDKPFTAKSPSSGGYPPRSTGGYAGKSGRSATGGYATRSPRDGAKPGRSGFGARPSRGDSRESRMGSPEKRASRPQRPETRIR